MSIYSCITSVLLQRAKPLYWSIQLRHIVDLYCDGYFTVNMDWVRCFISIFPRSKSWVNATWKSNTSKFMVTGAWFRQFAAQVNVGKFSRYRGYAKIQCLSGIWPNVVCLHHPRIPTPTVDLGYNSMAKTRSTLPKRSFFWYSSLCRANVNDQWEKPLDLGRHWKKHTYQFLFCRLKRTPLPLVIGYVLMEAQFRTFWGEVGGISGQIRMNMLFYPKVIAEIGKRCGSMGGRG